MKVAVISHCFPVAGVSAGGVSTATFQLCKGLQALGDVDLTVIRTLSRREDLGQREYDGIRVLPLPYRRHLTRPVALLWVQVAQVRATLREIRPDIAHIQDSSILARFIPDPKVFTLHGFVERDVLYEANRAAAQVRSLLLRLTYGLARRGIRNVIAISPYTVSVLKPDLRRRVWHVPNAITDAFFEGTPCPRRPTLLYAGRMTPLKNIATLIRGFANVAAALPGAELRLAGPDQDSPYGRECRRLARELGLEQRVRFLGCLDTAQLMRELADASLLMLCSLQENAPMVIAEAMAAGVPVVASRLGGIPWMLDGERCGCLVDDPRDPQQITATILRALQPDRWQVLGRAAKQRAEIFRTSRVAEQTVAVYREILDGA